MKITRIKAYITLLFLSGCSGVFYNSLAANPSYTTTVDMNYSKLGICLFENLSELNTNMFGPKYEIQARNDENEKIYYVHDRQGAGSVINYINWYVVVKNLNENNTKSEVQIRSFKKGIGIEPIAPIDLIKRYIKNCKV